MHPFHYAFKVKDIESTRSFYVTILGCTEGRSTDHWIDFDFFGNQLSAHISSEQLPLDYCGKVDGIAVPIPHFGCVLDYDQFNEIHYRLVQHNIEFIIQPYTRYEGQTGEQLTMFLLDKSGNPMEFKAFKNPQEMFAS
jgi:extradiol dioxygenase family protein